MGARRRGVAEHIRDRQAEDLTDKVVGEESIPEGLAEAMRVRNLTPKVERVTSETGGQKERKAAELGTIDPVALTVLAKVSGFGARKYEAFNYLRGYDWALSYNALQRHLMEFWSGEDLDPESGLPHAAHAAWHALALTSFLERGIGTDTRPHQAVREAKPLPDPGATARDAETDEWVVDALSAQTREWGLT